MKRKVVASVLAVIGLHVSFIITVNSRLWIQNHLFDDEPTIQQLDMNALPSHVATQQSPARLRGTNFLPPQNCTSAYPGNSCYYSWGPEGIDFRKVLRYINVTYYDNITWSKPTRSFKPFTAYVVIQNNEPSLWFSLEILKTIRGGAGRRLAVMLPHFQHALQVELYQQKELFPALMSLLGEVSGSFPLLFDLSDYHECSDPTVVAADERYRSAANVPLFTLARSPTCHYAFPIPTYSSYDYATNLGRVKDGTGRNRWQETMDDWARTYPWNQKISQVYWRGGCKTERYHFIRTASEFPFLNVRSVGNKCGRGAAAPRKAAPDPPEFSMTYKAVFDIDGNSWSERFPRLLCYNSAVVLLSLDDDFEEYFMVDLKPNVHFIPASMENFTQVAQMILRKKNDGMLKQIVQNANQWCRQRLTTERLNLDFLSVLNGYVATLNVGNPAWAEEWKRVALAHVGPATTNTNTNTNTGNAILLSCQADGAGPVRNAHDLITKASTWDLTNVSSYESSS